VDVFPGIDGMESAAEHEILGAVRKAIGERGICTIGLSGGETPRGLYRRLSALPEGRAPEWSRIQVCFVDERMVSPDDPESNYGMVRDELISRIPLPAGNVHRIRGERPPAVASAEYAADIEKTLSMSGGRFDVLLLGLGADGHTASLFPGTEVLGERGKPVSAVFVAALKSWRVTLTLPVINSARDVLFLVAGAKKADIVRRVLEARAPDPGIPATLVDPADFPPHWILDAEAGASAKGGALALSAE